MITMEDLLSDYGRLESGKCKIKGNSGNVASRHPGVSFDELSSRQAAGMMRGSPPDCQQLLRVFRFDPVG